MRHTAQEELKLVIQQINELTKVYHNAVSSHHISENEFWIWYILILTDGEHSQQSICDAWFLTKQTVNTIVGNMVKEGYAILAPIPGTKNHKSIHLTEQGKQHGEQIVLPIACAEQRALGRINIPSSTPACLKGTPLSIVSCPPAQKIYIILSCGRASIR